MRDDDLIALPTKKVPKMPARKVRGEMQPLQGEAIGNFRQTLKANSKDKDGDYDEEESNLYVRHNFDAKTRTTLEKQGVPHSAFLRAGTKICLDDSVMPISAELSKTRLRKISVAKQIRSYEKIIENPLWGSYLYVISSYPSDLRAKQVALSIMQKATEKFYQKKTNNKILMKRSSPVWHNVLGGFKDRYLEADLAHKPAFMVLSNVIEDSSQTKLEKLRDLLAMYESIPIVVVTSAQDPLSFMLGKLRHHGEAFMYIGPDDKDVSL